MRSFDLIEILINQKLLQTCYIGGTVIEFIRAIEWMGIGVFGGGFYEINIEAISRG